MEYNFNIIGERIKTLRKSRKLSQDSFLEILRDNFGFGISRNTLSLIENGNQAALTFDFLYKASKIFDCDIGFLLGEYEEKTKDVHDICSVTGLSESALEAITEISKKDAMSSILESSYFSDIVNIASEAIEDPYLHEQSSLIAADVIMRAGLAFDGAENVNYPPAYKHFTNVLSKHGISALYKQKFVEIASKLYDRLTNEEA